MLKPGPQELQRIALLIEAEANQLKKFLELLESEERALVCGDTDGLLTLAKEKTERYRQLQSLHDDRSLLMVRYGLGKDGNALRELLTKLPRAQARWDEVLTLAARARDRNDINGRLIAERMQHNQAALSVLLSAANRPQLYDAGGHSRPGGGGRMIGSA